MKKRAAKPEGLRVKVVGTAADGRGVDFNILGTSLVVCLRFDIREDKGEEEG